MIDFDRVADRVQSLKNQQARAAETEHREIAAAAEAKQEMASVEEARAITQTIAEEMQRRAHDKIAKVVTRCLAAVFDDPYEFNIRFERKRNKTEAVLEFRRDGQVYDDPINEVGGGVLDVASLALRLACVMVSRPPTRRAFVLDEPWSSIRGEGNRNRTRKLLETLSEEFGVQWIINTDIPSYRMGKIVEMGE